MSPAGAFSTLEQEAELSAATVCTVSAASNASSVAELETDGDTLLLI